MRLIDLSGHDLGVCERAFTADDAILYALAVGAGADDLELVFERDLRVLPTYACALGLWAVEAAGNLGAYDRTKSLHVGQRLEMKRPLRPGPVPMRGRVGAVHDKERLTIVEVMVSSEWFDAAYTILVPGVGGWGGEPPPKRDPTTPLAPVWRSREEVAPTAAALYRLTGDKHPVHIDPDAAAAMGLQGPILHGLATMGIAARAAAVCVGAHPGDLCHAEARLSAPVSPGDTLVISAEPADSVVRVEASVDDTVVLAAAFGYTDGRVL